ERFLTSLALVPAEPPPPHRVQDRTQAQPPGSRAAFVNTPDTDTSVAANRVWGDRIRERMESSTLGEQTAANGLLTSAVQVDELVARVVEAGHEWRTLGAERRAEVLHTAGDILQSRRAELLEVMGSEC